MADKNSGFASSLKDMHYSIRRLLLIDELEDKNALSPTGSKGDRELFTAKMLEEYGEEDEHSSS